MTIATSPLPISQMLTPVTAAEVAAEVRAAHDASVPLYPIGGGTALDFGLTPTKEGRGLETTGLCQIVDYTPRDMTIVAEAGVRMSDLAATLAAERQHLPIDSPEASQATLGGMVATNWSGPRRYGYGTLRDYVIGISAVDGRGEPFKGGGRVVKNVAGYDFCKLLTGSMGTIGVITQLTLKVRPQPETSVTVVAACADLNAADSMLEQLVQCPAPPAAIDLQAGRCWNVVLPDASTSALSLAVRFDGTESECGFMRDELVRRLAAGGGENVHPLDAGAAQNLLRQQVEFPRHGVGGEDASPLVIKIAVVPSAVPRLVALVLDTDPEATIGAQAGSGILFVRFSRFDASDLTSQLVARLRPAAVRYGGSLIVLASQFEGLTRQIVWGGRHDSSPLMEKVKQQFDPRGILNPDRFMF